MYLGILLYVMEVNLESVRVRLPEADGHEVGAGELSAPQLADFLQPLLDLAVDWQLVHAT